MRVPTLFIHVTDGKRHVVSLHIVSTCAKSSKSYSAHTHFRAGKLVIGKIIPYPCPVQKTVYTPRDPTIKKLVVVFHGRHSHPPWPEEKPNQAAKDDVTKCLDVLGIFGATGGRVDNGKRHSLTYVV